MLCIALFAGALLACTAKITTQGYVPNDDDLEQIKVGVDTADAVANRLGSPTSRGPFSADGSRTWYYIMRRTSRETFFAEKLVEQKVVALSFDPEGVLRNVERYDSKDGHLIDPVGRKTPTRGRKLGFWEQIFGNIGRFGG